MTLLPPTVTASTSGRRRCPWQEGHSRTSMYSSISRRDHSEVVSMYLRSHELITPSTGRVHSWVMCLPTRRMWTFSSEP